MQNLPEGLIYILALAGAYLVNYLFKRFGPKMEREPLQAELEDGQMAQETVPLDLDAASIVAAGPMPRPKVAVATTTLTSGFRGPLHRRALLGSKHNKQTAIALATILGPCRAFEPDGNHASPGR